MPEPRVHAGLREHASPDDAEAISIAELMHALSTPSRVKLLYALRAGEASVGELAERTGLSASAASQQLRVLRHLRFVATRRAGRTVSYRLHDDHVGVLLDEVRNHLDHAGRGRPAASAAGLA